MADILYYMGILMALLATIMFNIAPVFQKQALDKMPEMDKGNVLKSFLSLFKNKRWLTGFLIFLLASIPFAIATFWTGISVVQPLQSFGFIVLVIASSKMLGEKLNMQAKAAIGLMIIMPILIALSEVSPPQSDITQLAVQIDLYIFTAVILVIIGVSWAFTKKVPLLWANVMGLFFAIGAYYLQGALSLIEFAGYDLIAELGVVLKNVFKDPSLTLALVYFIVMSVFNVLAVVTSQIGFQKVAASKFNPIQQTINNVCSVIGGILIYGQMPQNWITYFIAMVFAVIGTLILGSYQMEKPKDAQPEGEQAKDQANEQTDE